MARHGFRGRRYGRNIGHERARQHIEDANRLAAELGGSIEDVKQYFFRLSPNSLRHILDEYERQYGANKRAYAKTTIDKWKTGSVQMSGTVAERLFRLLPPRMPLEEKYKLIDGLWSHVGPKSRKILHVGLDANIDHVLAAVRGHMDDVVTHYTIPPSLEKRFEWLASGDSRVKQQFLNHYLQYEKTSVVDGARLRVPILLEHLRSVAGSNTYRAAEVLKIGNHELEVEIDRTASGVRLRDPLPPTLRGFPTRSLEKKSWSFPWWIFWAVAALILLNLMSHR